MTHPDTTTVAQKLVNRATDDSVGLLFGSESLTWRDVVKECARRRVLLHANRSDGPFHVGVLLDNVPEFVFLLGGAALAGATVVAINPTRRGEELARDIRHTDCASIITDGAHVGLLDGLDLGSAAGRVHVCDTDEWRDELSAFGGAEVPEVLPGPDTLFMLIFTSGSTGAPKAVRCSQGRIGAFSGAGLGADDVLYCAMPLFHGNALASNWMPALTTGATIALRERFSASEFLSDIRRFGATFFNTIGQALSYVLATPETREDRDHQLRWVLAPEASARDKAEFERRFGAKVFAGYGSSEGAIILYPAAPPDALGTAPPGHDVAAVDPESGEERVPARFDEHGRLVNASDAIGELVRRDRGAVFEGYYGNAEAEAQRTRNGWFWSGDLVYRDDDGVFWFAGRTADWLRVDGENIAAAPVETVFGRFEAARAVAVYGVPDPRTGGDQLMLALELAPGAKFDPDAFGTFLAAQPDLSTKSVPRFVRIIDHLPLTATNKIDKQPLRAERWQTTDELWWRPGRSGTFALLTEKDVATLEQLFADHHRGEVTR